MGLFGNDSEQDKRLDALEEHIRQLTESVQRNQLDTVGLRLAVMDLQAQSDEKVALGDVDPAMNTLNDKLGKARVQLEEASKAASETWSTVQADFNSAVEELRAGVDTASANSKGE
jgi:hypothetical protein